MRTELNFSTRRFNPEPRPARKHHRHSTGQEELEELGEIIHGGSDVTYSQISGWELEIGIPAAPTAAQQAAIAAASDYASLNG
jgi:hypothetical protein